MVAKLHYALISTLVLSSMSSSFAGIERFWTTAAQKEQMLTEQFDECRYLSKEHKEQLILIYQNAKEETKHLDLKKRMEWFCKLDDNEQERMRLAWQNMSTSERANLKKTLESIADLEQRAEVRKEMIEKYSNLN